MMTIEEIKQQLSDRRVDVVSQATGVHYNTVYKIKTGKNINPTYNVIKALSDYFEGQK